MSDEVNTTHDNMLFEMLKECKTLPAFLNQIFGFLQRRTDFYHIAKDPSSPIGLPEGLAESLVRHTYHKWKPKSKEESNILQENEIPPVVEEEIVLTERDEIIDSMENIQIGVEPSNSPIDVIKSNSEPKSIFTNSESFNGSVFDNYCWSQTISEVDITVEVPEHVSTKDFQIAILPGRISVKMKDKVLLDGEFCQKCKNNEAIWSIDNRKLQIHLDKCKEIWWDCLVLSENRLDLTTLDCSRPYDDLPEDAQVKIQELNWNQERKRLGLPTSDDLAKQEILRRAWNAGGSPFSGPFDPSQVNFQ